MKIEYTKEIFFRKFYKKNEHNLISSKLGGKLCILMYCHRTDYFASFNSQKPFLECFHFVFRNLNRITSFMLSSVRFYHERQLQIVVAFSSPAFGLTFALIHTIILVLYQLGFMEFGGAVAEIEIFLGGGQDT